MKVVLFCGGLGLRLVRGAAPGALRRAARPRGTRRPLAAGGHPLVAVSERVRPCETCGNLTEAQPCDIWNTCANVSIGRFD